MAYQNNFQNSNNGNFQQVHISTNSLMLFSGDISLRISLYDQTISLTFTSAVTDAATGKRKFPKENGVSCLLTGERAMALYNVIRHRIIPSLEEHRTRCDFIGCNKDKTTLLGLEVTPENQVYLVLYTHIGEDRKPKTAMKYLFQQEVVISDYNAETGEFNADQAAPIHAQLLLFMKMLEGFAMGTMSPDHHFGKYNDRFSDKRIMATVGAMANSLGVTAPNYNSNIAGTNVAPGGSFNPNAGTSTNGVPVSNVSSVNEMFNDTPFN